MIIAHSTSPVPRKMLLWVFSLALFAVIATFYSQWTGVGQQPDRPLAVVLERSLVFMDNEDGGIVVKDGETGDDVHMFAPDEAGFVRNALTGLAFSRQKMAVGAEAPFRLVSTQQRGLILIDPVTDHQIELNAFGRTNAKQFNILLDPEQARIRKAALDNSSSETSQ